MDFLRRSDQPQAPRSNYSQTAPAPTSASEPEKHKRGTAEGRGPKWLRIAFVILFASVAVMALSLSGLFYASKNPEANLVNSKEEQAVFLTNGQVYFGHITTLNAEYMEVQGIFYLNSTSSSTTSTTTTQPTDLSLVKLGCELHGPEDQMIINGSQVSFWENLKSSGKVSQAITQWNKENPNGQQCSTTTSSTQQSTPAASSTTTPSTTPAASSTTGQ